MKKKLTFLFITLLFALKVSYAQYFGGSGSGHSYSCADTILCFLPISITGTDSVCPGSAAILSVSGGQTYLWNTGSTNASINTSPVANTVYTVTVSDNGCTNTGTFSVAVSSGTVSVAGSTSICNGQPTTLSASGTNNYSWSPASGLSSTTGSTVTISATAATTYTLIAWSDQGCYDTLYIPITLVSTADASITPVGPYCNDPAVPVQLVAIDTGGTWSGSGIVNPSTGSFSSSVAGVGTHQIIYTISGSCGDADTIDIIVLPNPSADAGSNATILLGSTVTLNATGAGVYLWYPSDGLTCTTCANPVASPTQTTTYYVQVTDSNQCISIDSVTISVEEECKELYVPNVFSPNGDSQNELFFVYGGNCIKTMSLIIYDRWGKQVAEIHSPQEGWDGKIKGKRSNTAVFAYILKAELTTGESVFKRGNVTLIR